ncbi:MAG: calcium-binding protein [Microcoleaceae cyanobacterium]
MELDESLNLDERLGAPGEDITVGINVSPETVSENADQYTLTFNLSEPAPEEGLRVIWSETDSDNAFGDLEFPPELTNASNLEDIDAVGDELARSAITIDAGATTATVTWTTLADDEAEDDETTTIELQPGDGYVVDADNQTEQIVIEDIPVAIEDDQLIEGSSQGEVLNGGTGDDTIVGFAGGDTLAGSDGDDSIVGNNGRDFLYGQDGDDILEGRPGFDRLFGGDGDDVLNGGIGRDRLNGGPGDDTMTGGASIDRFIYNTNEAFDSDDLGVDTILEFQQRDLILFDKSTFTALDSAAGNGFSVDSDFAIVADDDAADSSNAFIIYSEASGGLFYNSDGEMNQFAILDGAPTISEDNFQIR